MASTVKKQTTLCQIWGALVAILLAVWLTLWLTRPAVTAVSMTPLSGLITLKATAADAVPYEVAIANQKPTLVEFYADWCTTCQHMSATVDQLHRQYGHQINFVMLNIDDPQWAAQIADYRATGVPQFTLLTSDQTPVETWVGKVPALIFSQVFDQVLNPVS
ncbi:MAG: thioredoxin domain-containing protein [Phormidesmis sp.]